VALAAWLSAFYSPLNGEPDLQRLFCGLDCEWCPPWWRGPGEEERVCTIQLYAPQAGALLFSTGPSSITSLPEGLSALLEDKRVIKMGVNVWGDATRLQRDFGVATAALHDIADAKKKSLQDLVNANCPRSMHIDKKADKSKVRLGNWAEWPLSEEQVEYAALDAVLSFWGMAYKHGARWGMPDTEIERKIPSKITMSDMDPTNKENADAAGGEKTKPSADDKKNANFFVMHRNKSISVPNLGKKEHPQGPKDALRGVVICISGVLDSMSRADMEEYVAKHGGKAVKSVSKKVTHLVNDHGETGPSKREKCAKFKISIVSEDVIFDLVRAKM